MAEDKPQRIAKMLARAGLCSRREAERWIAEGRVAVDGTVLTSPAVTVTPANKITVDGETVGAAERARLWRYYKPTGVVTTERDPQGRPTVLTHRVREAAIGAAAGHEHRPPRPQLRGPAAADQ
jgi:23S rRNA pseudouridine2605 synthase